MYRLVCEDSRGTVVYDKEFSTQEELQEYFEDELTQDASSREAYVYTVYKRDEWKVIPWRQRVEFL